MRKNIAIKINNLSKVLKDINYVESVIAIGDLQKLKKDKKCLIIDMSSCRITMTILKISISK